MKVSQRMTPDPKTVTPKSSHRQAVELMREHNIRRLPVVDGKGRLVGIVSYTDLLSTAPSPVTSLSVYEIYGLLDRLTIREIMVSPVITVQEDCDLAAAANFMIASKVGCLPVMKDDKLVGIITETDIYKAFVEVLGGGQPGLRVDLRVPDQKGMLAEVARAVAESGGNIKALTVFRADDSEHAEISIKEEGASEARLTKALEAMSGVIVSRVRQAGTDKTRKFPPK